MWAGFEISLGVGMILEAAALTTQIAGEVSPPTSRLARDVRGQPLGDGRWPELWR